MLIVFIVFVFICLYNIKFSKNGFSDYLSKEQSIIIKGIFAIIIFLSHFNSYVVFENNIYDKIYLKIFSGIGQLCVVLFLFFSGYGIYMSSIKKENYFKDFPKNRILKTIINFDCAVLLFLISNIILNIKNEPIKIILSFIGWESIGNSNWFVFSIVCMYIITFIIVKINKEKLDNKSLTIITLATALFIIFLRITKKEEVWWYNTIACYTLGLWYGRYKTKIDMILQKKYLKIFGTTIVLFILFYYFRNYNFVIYEIMSILFTIMFVITMYKIKISNKVLGFFGKYSFEIYILQRLPYMFLIPLISNKYLLFILSFSLTLIISIIFNKVVSIIDDKIIKR